MERLYLHKWCSANWIHVCVLSSVQFSRSVMSDSLLQNDRILKEELPRSVGAQYATGDQWRNNSRKNEGMDPKQKQYPVVDGTGDRSKVQCCKEQYCISSVQFSHSVMSDSLRPHELQHARPPCPSPTPGVHSGSRPSSQ